MGIPCAFITYYQELVRKLVHQFAASFHTKMSTSSMSNIRQDSSESLRDYLNRFNEVTIKVAPQNQEMFVGEFQNELRTGHFNESLA